MTRVGRPKKSPDEKYVTRSVRFPPGLWQSWMEIVPPRQRSSALHLLMEREIRRLKRLRREEGSQG